MKIFFPALLLLFTLPAYDGPPAEKAKWVAFCVNGLKDTGEKELAHGVYCRRMSDCVDTAGDRRLYEWERMLPPAHLACYKKSGLQAAASAIKT